MKALSLSQIGCGILSFAAILIVAGGAGPSKPQKTDSDFDTPSFVRAALMCELGGRNAERSSLLAEALKAAPNDSTVHWQLGQVQGDRKAEWLSPAQVEQAAQKDRRLAEYRQRRDAAKPTLADQIALAQWCRKNKLDAEERTQWFLVLQIVPNYPEAVQRLGQLQPRKIARADAESAQAKADAQRVGTSLERWRSIVAEWQRSIANGEKSPPAEVREKIVNISEASEMLTLQKAILQEVRGRKTKLVPFALSLTGMLGDNPHPVAAVCLAHLAVFADSKDVRDSAVEGLKRHPLDHYVPLLLASLQSTIDADVRFDVDGNGNLISSVQLYREGDLADYSYSHVRSPESAPFVPRIDTTSPNGSVNTHHYGDGRDIPGNYAAWPKYQTPVQTATQQAFPGIVQKWQASEKSRYATIQRIDAEQKMLPLIDAMRMEAERQINAQNSRAIGARKANAAYDEIARCNRAIEERNASIVSVLGETTGGDVGEQPIEWWKWWWNQYNETNAVVDRDESPGNGSVGSPGGRPPYKPVVSYHTRDSYLGYTPIFSPTAPASRFTAQAPPTAVTVQSCFAPGTEVWTQTGREAIEKIKVGDRVLAQDVDTGELAYKPVLGVSIRPPQERLKIGVGADSFVATPGHPFWVDGKGWQLAKQLEVGQILHGVAGGTPVKNIEAIETDPTSAGYSYNLYVADFESYFVGEQGILVHDNDPRQPTASIIPGLTAEATAASAEKSDR
jgi:hypothetical protein